MERLITAMQQATTPAYAMDLDALAYRVQQVHQALGDKIPLCYSIKANPFLVRNLPSCISYLEVCSPGELRICEETGVDMSTVIFSGVNKTKADIQRALQDQVGIFTAESFTQAEAIDREAVRANQKVKLIARLTSGNQFGMDAEDLQRLAENRDQYNGIELIGIHYYSGTQKKKAAAIQKELLYLSEVLQALRQQTGFEPCHVEYGPGLACDYFGDCPEKTDLALLEETSVMMRGFAEHYPVTVEMGRFLAGPCGTYFTRVQDVKTNHGICYAICDGGVHQLNYYGQMMAMQVPPVTVINSENEPKVPVCLCGSLCTTADVLVRRVELAGVKEDALLAFSRCGAYSVTEGMALFLSRELPAVYLYSQQKGLQKVRSRQWIYGLNMPQSDKE